MGHHPRCLGDVWAYHSRLLKGSNPREDHPPRRDIRLNQDFLDLLEIFLEEGVLFLVVGAHALAIHGTPRATGDLDLWIRTDPENARRVWEALSHFGAPLEDLSLSVEDLTQEGTVFQVGLPPRRIDVLTQISGVEFGEAWDVRIIGKVAHLKVPFLGREHLLKNKKASGRPKDLLDLALLEESEPID